MKVTKDEKKYRQPRQEGCPQKAPAERVKYEEAYDSSRIAENNITNTCLLLKNWLPIFFYEYLHG